MDELRGALFSISLVVHNDNVSDSLRQQSVKMQPARRPQPPQRPAATTRAQRMRAEAVAVVSNARAEMERADFDASDAVDFWDLTNRQDWAAVESVQRGLSHPAFVPGVLAEQESDVYRFVTMVARGYRGEPITGGPSPRRSPAAGSASG